MNGVKLNVWISKMEPNKEYVSGKIKPQMCCMDLQFCTTDLKITNFWLGDYLTKEKLKRMKSTLKYFKTELIILVNLTLSLFLMVKGICISHKINIFVENLIWESQVVKERNLLMVKNSLGFSKKERLWRANK